MLRRWLLEETTVLASTTQDVVIRAEVWAPGPALATYFMQISVEGCIHPLVLG